MNSINQKQVVPNQNASVKSSGKTVDEAIANGLSALNTTKDRVDIEIVKEGSRGILGIGAEDAEVVLTLKPEPEPDIPADPDPAPEAPLLQRKMTRMATSANLTRIWFNARNRFCVI